MALTTFTTTKQLREAAKMLPVVPRQQRAAAWQAMNPILALKAPVGVLKRHLEPDESNLTLQMVTTYSDGTQDRQPYKIDPGCGGSMTTPASELPTRGGKEFPAGLYYTDGVVGNLPTAATPKDVPVGLAFEAIKDAMKDEAYAWSWHCNIAMPIMDADKYGSVYRHEKANRQAAAVMLALFGVDVTQFDLWKSLEKQWADQLAEDRRKALGTPGVFRNPGILTLKGI